MTVHIVEGVNGSYCYASVCERDPADGRKNVKYSKCIGHIKNGSFLPNEYLTSLLLSHSMEPNTLSGLEKMIVGTTLEKYGQSVAQMAKEQPIMKTGRKYDTAKTVFYGTQLILGHITRKYQLEKMLASAFAPDMAADILSLAWFVTSDGGALSNNDAFLNYQESPSGVGISSQDVSRLLDNMTEDGIMSFYRQWLKYTTHKTDDRDCPDKVLYDLTSISFTGHGIAEAEPGYNRDRERYNQVNFAMLCLRGTGMPLFAWVMNGSVSDVRTLITTLQFLDKLGYKADCLMMDRAFGTRENITYMLAHKQTFFQSLKVASNWVYRIADLGDDERSKPTSQLRIGDRVCYGSTTNCMWVRYRNEKDESQREEILVFPGSGKRGGKYFSDDPGIHVIDQHPCRIHTAFFQDLVGDQYDEFMGRLLEEYNRLKSDETSNVKKEYEKFFTITKAKYARHRDVQFNTQTIQQHKSRYAGYICFITNDPAINTVESALKEYATRDVIEKDFDDMKNTLDMNRLHVHTGNRMRARLFIQFIAEIFLREIRNCFRNSKTCKKMTRSQFANHMKTITKVKFKGRYRDVYPELTKHQREIVEALGIGANDVYL
jgi:transposase